MIIPIEFSNEEYRYITRDMVPDIDENRYMISNYGNVLDVKSYREVQQQFVGCGYLSVFLHTSNGYKRNLVHRLVGMAFIPGVTTKQINHKYGIKIDNYYENLEWNTPRENLLHAIEFGLNYRGEDKPNAILTNEQVHHICKYLESGFDYNQIVDTMGLGYIKNIHDILHDIKCGKSWRFISSQYDIPKHKIVNGRQLSNDQVDIICKALQDNPSVSNRELFEKASIEYLILKCTIKCATA